MVRTTTTTKKKKPITTVQIRVPAPRDPHTLHIPLATLDSKQSENNGSQSACSLVRPQGYLHRSAASKRLEHPNRHQ
jgi:hypothetical protein